MLGAPHHPKFQGAFEVFSKYFQNSLYKAYDNISRSNEEEIKRVWKKQET